MDAFRRSSSTRDGRQGWCRDCQRSNAQSRLRNPENQERNRARARQWGLDNPERKRASEGRWQSANPERTRVFQARHRAAAFGVTSTLTHEQWAEVLADFADMCAYCQAPFETIDHVRPMAAGGGNCKANVVPACATCNNSKHNKLVGEWVPPSAHPHLSVVLGAFN